MMMRYLRLICLFSCLFTSASIAGSLIPDSVARVQALTLQGLDRAYNYDFTAANRLFDAAIAVEPLHPRPYVSKSLIALWKYLLTRSDADSRELISLTDKAIEQGEQYINTYGEDADALTCLGAAYGCRAFAHARAKSYFRSAWDGKKSYDYLCDALQRDPHAYDAYLGLGMFHYFAAHISKPLRWIVSILGVSGDSERGIREIRLAAQKGVFHRVEAQYFLSQFLPWEDGDFASGEQIISDLRQEYPANPLLQFTLAVWRIQRHDIVGAQALLEPIVRRQSDVQPYALYKLAECSFRLSNYDEARTLYQSFLRSYSNDTYRATANYRIAVCLEMTGHRAEAVEFYKRAASDPHSFGDDAYSVRKASRHLSVPMSESDTSLIRAQNALRSGAYEQALALYTRMKSSGTADPTVAAETEFGLGEALFHEESYNNALEHYQSVRSIAQTDERWLLPWSHYQSGLCDLKLGRPEAAREEFKQVQQYDDYDFKEWLRFRAERELAKLGT